MAILSSEKVKQLLLSLDFDLQPTQIRLCLPILQRIHHKMRLGVTFNHINIANGLLIEGHHRYICSLLSQVAIGRNEWERPSALLAYKWSEVQVDETDWETTAMVQRHNAKDAAKSGIDLSALIV